MLEPTHAGQVGTRNNSKNCVLAQGHTVAWLVVLRLSGQAE